MSHELTDSQILADLIGTLQRYGYNVDRKSLSPVLLIVLQDLKARQQVAETMIRYLESPHLLAIDTAPTRDLAMPKSPQNAKPPANLNPSPEGFLSYMLILLFSRGRAIITSSA